MNTQKIGYFVRSAKKRLLGLGRSCPSCGSKESCTVASKFGVTELRRCRQCQLLFRVPTTSASENFKFYQRRYRQDFTTEVPGPEELSRLLKTGFRGSRKDFSTFISILDALGVSKGARLFDFGCSWGYGSWQFSKAGYEVESYEISQPRRHFAMKNLGCIVHSALADVRMGFDVFFSSHVLEHIPSLEEAIKFAESILKPGGLFIAFTPNGSMEHRCIQPQRWQQLWGLVHPNFLDEKYYEQRFGDNPYLLMTDPYDLDEIVAWREEPSQWTSNLSGPELMCAVRIESYGRSQRKRTQNSKRAGKNAVGVS